MPQPFLKFYPKDWDADAELNSCSLAARGLWIHMIRVMHEAEPYGYFVGRNGEPIQPTMFSRRIGATRVEVAKLLNELEAAGVFSRDRSGRIFSRRMVRDAARREAAVENGRRGGNPNLKGSPYPQELMPGLTPDVNTYSNTQKPDTRSQIPSYVLDFVSHFAGPEIVKSELGLDEWIDRRGLCMFRLRDTQLRVLSADDRVELGRIHALLFSGYRSDSTKNRDKGVTLAATFSRMGLSPRLGDITVREYVKYGVKLLKLRNGKPFHNPFDIEAVVEYE